MKPLVTPSFEGKMLAPIGTRFLPYAAWMRLITRKRTITFVSPPSFVTLCLSISKAPILQPEFDSSLEIMPQFFNWVTVGAPTLNPYFSYSASLCVMKRSIPEYLYNPNQEPHLNVNLTGSSK